MKRIISMLACAAMIFSSCQKDPKPSASFETGNYVMGADEPLTVKVVVTDAPAADLTIEFNASGSAVKGTDYELSAESFTIKAGETTGEITVTPLNNLTSNLNINLALTLPTGYEAGKYTSTTIALASKEKASYSFAKKEAKLVDELEIVLNLIGETSTTNFVAGGEISFPFVIESTAVAGTDYEIKGGATAFVFAKGQKSASITLKSLVADPEGAKEIVVKLDETAIADAYGDRFTKGVIASTKAIITKGLIFADLEGKWAYAGAPVLQSDGTDGIDIWTLGALVEEAEDGGFKDDFSGITILNHPEGTNNDVLEFKSVGGKMTLVPSGNGSVLNFFKECEVTKMTPESYSWYNFSPAKPMNATKLSLSAADILFAANEDSINAADIIVNLSEDGKTMNLFITTSNYTPSEFFMMTYMVFADMWTTDFCAQYDLYFTFTKVE